MFRYVCVNASHRVQGYAYVHVLTLVCLHLMTKARILFRGRISQQDRSEKKRTKGAMLEWRRYTAANSVTLPAWRRRLYVLYIYTYTCVYTSVCRQRSGFMHLCVREWARSSCVIRGREPFERGSCTRSSTHAQAYIQTGRESEITKSGGGGGGGAKRKAV